ncbi:P-loop containing nucleoside triphosphate hydrolase superfamily protein [Zea mays]|uniref:p-loop containing nucleoside triphosphate hydrolase superfamily protein n=1 Tax=Zea mays TaxID=4577 RepID=A0A1D6MTY5_MAIZE|nr:P-loop containing nucleoside triphosphate hydrolase superfamily protein [Zea mays]
MAEPPLAAGCTTNWRREADERLRRLHSLLFGADAALEHGDATVAQALALRLLGFLDSQALAAGAGPEDAAFVAPIRTAASARLAAASRARASDSDRAAFELARTDVGCVFANQGDNNVERIQRSKYFQALLQKSKANVSEQRNATCQEFSVQWAPCVDESQAEMENEKLSIRASKLMMQTKLTSLYSSKSLKTNGVPNKNMFKSENSSKVCAGVENRTSQNSNRRHAYLDVEEDEKSHGQLQNAKWKHTGFRSPIFEVANSPSSNDEADAPANEFTTAKRMMQICLLHQAIIEMLCAPDGELPEKLRNLEPRLIEHVSNEIMDRDPNVRWNDIAGLEHAKKCVTEMVIWPLLRPDIFRGCRSPGRGLLLFGPPGTGKTMIGKAIAGEAKATFFYISASSLTSKWVCMSLVLIFNTDNFINLLSKLHHLYMHTQINRKSDGEHESSRRLKTQFLIEMEGFDTGNEQILLIETLVHHGCEEARAWIIRNLLEKDGLFMLSEEETSAICKLTEGYSGSDMKNLVKDASMGPLREALQTGVEIAKLSKEDMRPVMLKDFENAMREVRPSVSSSELGTYEEWNRQFGSLSI